MAMGDGGMGEAARFGSAGGNTRKRWYSQAYRYLQPSALGLRLFTSLDVAVKPQTLVTATIVSQTHLEESHFVLQALECG